VRVLLDVSAVPARPVGAGNYTVALASGLARRSDVDLHLLTRGDDEPRWGTIAPGAAVHGAAPARRPARLAWEQARGASVAKRLRPDVWHGPHYTMPMGLGPHGPGPLGVGPLHDDVPCVVTIHDLTFFDHPEWHERAKVAFFRRMIRASARRAAVVICVSEYTAERLRALVHPRALVRVARHGVDHERFDAHGDEAADLAALAGHGIAPPYIAFASTIEPRKNVPTLVRAFARVAAGRPDLRLVVAGSDGWGAREVRDAIAASGVATQVIRPGYLADGTIAPFFRRAEVVAYPSFEEGFGLPALEGLACGAPVVTTEGSALSEVVGDAALTVSPDDPNALADAINSILDDPSIAARLRAAGPRRAAQFTWERCVDEHVDAYQQAIGAGVPS
jgi:glycosyltransferase involved in cell wall biosynthesis